MGAPNVFRHTSDLSVIGCAEFDLVAVAADVEAFQVDDELLTFGEIAVESALIDGDDESARSVLHGKLLVEVAAEVVATDAHAQFDVVFDEFVAAVGDGILVVRVCLQFSDGDDAFLGDAVVAEGRLTEFRVFPVVVEQRVVAVEARGQCEHGRHCRDE